MSVRGDRDGNDETDGHGWSAAVAAVIGAFAPSCYAPTWVPWLRWVGAAGVVVILLIVVIVLHLVVGMVPVLPAV